MLAADRILARFRPLSKQFGRIPALRVRHAGAQLERTFDPAMPVEYKSLLRHVCFCMLYDAPCSSRLSGVSRVCYNGISVHCHFLRCSRLFSHPVQWFQMRNFMHRNCRAAGIANRPFPSFPGLCGCRLMASGTAMVRHATGPSYSIRISRNSLKEPCGRPGRGLM